VSLLVFVLLTVSADGRGVSAGESAPPTAFVYVETNDPEGNAILGFTRGGLGRLTPLPGSPFPAGGRGMTPPFAPDAFQSDQNVVIGTTSRSTANRYLFAVNGGSDSVAVFRLGAHGAIAHVPGSPFHSGGANPGSVGVDSNAGVLVVANKGRNDGIPGAGLPNYTSFHINDRGWLAPIPGSTVSIRAGSGPTQALISPTGRFVFGAETSAGLVRSFLVSPSGRLVPAAAVEPPLALFAPSGRPPTPFGLAAHPTHPLLYVGLPTINHVATFDYSVWNELRFVGAVRDTGDAPCWLRTNRAGTHLYASNAGDSSIGVYSLAKDPHTPTQIQRIVLKGGGHNTQFTLEPSEHYLEVISRLPPGPNGIMAAALHVVEILHDGTLQEVASSPTILPVTELANPQGVAAF
jgi:6-phosphogluconolactonase (cycloisomerase 2 family)